MFVPDRILVPVDFGDCSETAFRQAAAVLVRHPSASLRLVHVYEPPYYAPEALVNLPGEPPLPMLDYIRQQAEKQLAHFVETHVAGTPLADRVDARIAAGLAFEEVPREAAAWGADLIVMGTHGRQGLSHLLLGSVAERVIRDAPCPVLVVRGTNVPAPDRALVFDRVLVAVDFGPDSVAAARLGMALATNGAADVTLLHVVPTPAYAGEVLVPRAGGIRLGEFLHDEAQLRLETFARELVGGARRPTARVLQGSAAEQTVQRLRGRRLPAGGPGHQGPARPGPLLRGQRGRARAAPQPTARC
jgi:universal stress protein A